MISTAIERKKKFEIMTSGKSIVTLMGYHKHGSTLR